ncbi:MAG: putative membrane protein YccC [Marivirga sp.]|jgi:uncharacterized membrane protein YccC
MVKQAFNISKKFITSPDFLKALLVTFGIVVPILLGVQLNYLKYSISVAIGVFVTFSSDVPGSRRHKTVGILTAATIAMLASMSTRLASDNYYLLFPILGLLIFSISYISIYGFRASLISFSGLLAIVLSFANKQIGIEILLHGLLIGLGGIWALLLSFSFHNLLQKRQIENGLADCLILTSEYMRLRGQLALAAENSTTLQTALYDLQVKLNALHETLRELLLNERQNSGLSNFKRKQLLIFIELIDIMELSLANPANNEQINTLFAGQKALLKPFIDLGSELSNRLERIGYPMKSGSEMRPVENLNPLIENCKLNVRQYIVEVKLPKAREGALLLHNLIDYEEQQLQKIESIEIIFKDLEGSKSSELQGKAGKKFITQQDYDPAVLKENFTFKSPIFKHSVRLTIAMLVGFSVGIIFSIQNAYWILLTIVVIMRPGYTLTKERSKQRLYGTLIGAAIAAVIVLISQNTYLYTVLSIISLMLAFSFLQKNYRTASIFVTTSVIFIYALINPNAFQVIQFRIIDTLTGAAISMLAISFLWPAWEIQNIKTVIATAIKASRNYLTTINDYYHQSAEDRTSYKLARKEAFLGMGNLNGAFQRMSQEPESKQKNLGKLYEIVGLNHTFLAATAALGTYLLSKKNEEVSDSFEVILAAIDSNLNQALQSLQKQELTEDIATDKLEEAYENLDEQFNQLVAIRTKQLEEDNSQPIDPDVRKKMQKEKLISDQLKWLATISGNLKKLVKELD